MKTLSGVCMAYLVLQQPAWWEAVLGVVFLATFWRELNALYDRVRLDAECRRFRQGLKCTLHAQTTARIAWVSLKGGIQ